MIDKTHGGNIWPHLKNAKNKIIDFSANINPLPLPSKIKKVIIKNINNLSYYPEPESKSLKKSLASFHKISPANLLTGNGSIELIYLVIHALKPKNILLFQPTFSEYEFAARANGIKPVFLRSSAKDNFAIDLAKIKGFIPGVDLVFLCNPNNPTGYLLPQKEILLFWRLCKKYKTALVVDEVFMDFIPEEKRSTLVKEAVKNRNLFVLKSLTKLFCLAGLRIGYLIGQQAAISKLGKLQYPWNVNLLAQRAAEEAIKNNAFVKKTQDLINKEREYLSDNLNRINGLKVYPSEANFFLCKLESHKIKNAKELSDRLIKKGILIRNCSNFRGLSNRFFRIAIRKRKENNKLISLIKDILK